MNREIKFRVFDKVKKEFILDGHSNVLMIDLFGGIYRVHNDSCESPISELNNCIISQYTGISDKYGRHIFEGDIMDYGNGRVFYVIYSGCQFVATFNEKSTNAIISIQKFKVIGDIFANPELLIPNH